MSAGSLPAAPPQPQTADPRAQAPKLTHVWRRTKAALFLGIAAILALYWQSAWSIAFTWWDSPAFSHGFLILPIAGFLIWTKRAHLAALAPRPSLLGVGTVTLGAFGWLIGKTAGVLLIQQVALVFVLQGLVLAVLGPAASAVIAFPLFYLYFGVPFGTFLIPPLQDVTAAFVVRSLHLVGVPVFLDGVFIHIPSGNFEVAEACAGLRFLITSVSLGVIFAHEFYSQLWRRGLFVVLSVVVPIVANGLRAAGLVLLAHYSNYKLAAGTDHLTYGLIFLSFVLFCLLGLGYSFREPPRSSARHPSEGAAPAAKRPGATTQPRLRLAAAVLGSVLITTASWAYAAHIAGRAEGEPARFAPPAIADWRFVAPAYTDWKPIFSNTSQELIQGYRQGADQVDLYIAYFARQRQGQEVVNFLNSVTGREPWQRAGNGAGEVSVGGRKAAYSYERMVAGPRQRMVWYWYWVDGRVTASPYVAKLLEVKAKLLGGTQAAAVIAIAADYGDAPRRADQTLGRFLERAWPLGRALPRSEN